MKRSNVLFSIIIFFAMIGIVRPRKHGERLTRKVRYHLKDTNKSSSMTPEVPEIAFGGFKSTKSPKYQNISKGSKSTKAPVENHSMKYESTKMPVGIFQGDGSVNYDPLPFMRKHAESLEDLDAILFGSNLKDFNNAQVSTTSESVDLILVSADNAPTFECINNYEFVTIDGFDCKSIDADDIRRQKYCTDLAVHSNCPQVCGKCCQDNVDFSFNFTKDCEWLRNLNTDTTAIENQCAKQDVRNACPVGCSLCDFNDINCADDPTYIIKTEVKDCAWLNAASDERRERVCGKSFVRDACQVTCNMCRPYVTIQPSLAPSSLPSTSPTSNATIDQFLQTNSPSSLPSDNPSTSPSPTNTECDMPPRDPIIKDVKCADDPTYVAPFGGDCGCELFQGTDCNTWGALLDNLQLAEVWERCPVSCGLSCQ